VRYARQIAALLFIIAIPVALVTSNVRIVLNQPRVYAYATDHYHTTETTGISRSDLLRASAEVRRYFNNREDTLFIRVNSGGQTISLFNDRETAHMRDVKHLFQLSFRVQEGAIVYIMAYVVMVFIWTREGTVRRLAREVLAGGVLGLVVLGGLGLFAIVGFDSFWTDFHSIAFPSGNWEFDPATDHLIQMFPDDFWRDVTIWIGAGTIAELAFLAVVSGGYLMKTRERHIDVSLPDGAVVEA
jgi:integral membrane protein (TIGR01906 family)